MFRRSRLHRLLIEINRSIIVYAPVYFESWLCSAEDSFNRRLL